MRKAEKSLFATDTSPRRSASRQSQPAGAMNSPYSTHCASVILLTLVWFFMGKAGQGAVFSRAAGRFAAAVQERRRTRSNRKDETK